MCSLSVTTKTSKRSLPSSLFTVTTDLIVPLVIILKVKSLDVRRSTLNRTVWFVASKKRGEGSFHMLGCRMKGPLRMGLVKPFSYFKFDFRGILFLLLLFSIAQDLSNVQTLRLATTTAGVFSARLFKLLALFLPRLTLRSGRDFVNAISGNNHYIKEIGLRLGLQVTHIPPNITNTCFDVKK